MTIDVDVDVDVDVDDARFDSTGARRRRGARTRRGLRRGTRRGARGCRGAPRTRETRGGAAARAADAWRAAECELVTGLADGRPGGAGASASPWRVSFVSFASASAGDGDSARVPARPRDELGLVTQRGALRSHCVDCLDRTNVAQFAWGLAAPARSSRRSAWRTAARFRWTAPSRASSSRCTARWGTRSRCSTAGARRTPRRATWATAGGPNGPGPAGTATRRGEKARAARLAASARTRAPPRRGGVILREDARLRAPVLQQRVHGRGQAGGHRRVPRRAPRHLRDETSPRGGSRERRTSVGRDAVAAATRDET